MLICRLKQSLALTRKSISKWHHYAIRNVRRAIRTEMANKRDSVNWYQPDFHMSEKTQTKRILYCFPIKKDIVSQFRPFLQLGRERRVEQLKNWYQVTIFEWLSKTPNVNVIFLCVWNDHHRINLARVLQIRSTYFPDLFSISCIPRTFGVVHAI